MITRMVCIRHAIMFKPLLVNISNINIFQHLQSELCKPLILQQEHVVDQVFRAMASKRIKSVVSVTLVFFRLSKESVKINIVFLYLLNFFVLGSTIKIPIQEHRQLLILLLKEIFYCLNLPSQQIISLLTRAPCQMALCKNQGLFLVKPNIRVISKCQLDINENLRPVPLEAKGNHLLLQANEFVSLIEYGRSFSFIELFDGVMSQLKVI